MYLFQIPVLLLMLQPNVPDLLSPAVIMPAISIIYIFLVLL